MGSTPNAYLWWDFIFSVLLLKRCEDNYIPKTFSDYICLIYNSVEDGCLQLWLIRKQINRDPLVYNADTVQTGKTRILHFLNPSLDDETRLSIQLYHRSRATLPHCSCLRTSRISCGVAFGRNGASVRFAVRLRLEVWQWDAGSCEWVIRLSDPQTLTHTVATSLQRILVDHADQKKVFTRSTNLKVLYLLHGRFRRQCAVFHAVGQQQYKASWCGSILYVSSDQYMYIYIHTSFLTLMTCGEPNRLLPGACDRPGCQLWPRCPFFQLRRRWLLRYPLAPMAPRH